MWIEITDVIEVYEWNESPSTRRVWIEMYVNIYFTRYYFVTLHPEGVD